ncbi:hypothetical protein H0H93_014835 [Arthromyces matolae]|nr:hypothetical protein H0H93_014835 [Arthromyces matolae]
MVSQRADRCELTSVPLEIFNRIVFELTCLEPLGPPIIVVPLMQTCRAIHTLLLSENNPILYGEIYRFKFDAGAVARRAFCPTQSQCVIQLRRILKAMSVFRRGNFWDIGLEDHDIGLEEALQVAFMMLLDDDGKNATQLLLWARADVFIKNFLLRRLYENSEHNDGWPIDNVIISHALWVAWLLTSEESLLNESNEEREHMKLLLFPLVYLPSRYTTAFAPPNHFLLPIDDLSNHPVGVETPHGQYPVYHGIPETSWVYYDGRPTLVHPPAASAAVLLYLARFEVNPMAIGAHFYRTRADRHAAGVFTVGPTQENIEEYNWGRSVHPPLGTGLRTRSGERKMVKGWGGREWDQEKDAEQPFPSRPQLGAGVNLSPPIPKWIGKAPHFNVAGNVTKSRKWDSDWNRVRFCANLTWSEPRVPYGTTGSYEPGTIVGLWQGIQLIPTFSELKEIQDNPRHPPPEHWAGLRISIQPVFLRLREIHGVQGEWLNLRGLLRKARNINSGGRPSDHPIGFDRNQEHEGMMNGWFSGPRVKFTPQEDGTIFLQANGETGIYKPWKGRRRAEGRGNESYTVSELANGEDDGTKSTLRDAEDSVQYDHDEYSCPKCADRRRFRKLIRIVQTGTPEDVEKALDDGLLQPWDADEEEEWSSIQGPDSVPPAIHEWERRGKGPCDGIQDIVIFGEVSDHFLNAMVIS